MVKLTNSLNVFADVSTDDEWSPTRNNQKNGS